MRQSWLFLTLAVLCTGCSSTVGEPLDPKNLGYRACDSYFECGPGRYCTQDGTCFADCRSSADCALLGTGMVCNRFGQCNPPDGDRSCSRHQDCGTVRFCNGSCSQSDRACGSTEDCPTSDYPDDVCRGKCGANCLEDDDCRESCAAGRCTITDDRCQEDADCTRMSDQTCTPVGQCLQPGWEKWIPPGEIPPVGCTRDSQCKVLGWRWACDCDKSQDPRSKLEVCIGGAESICVEDINPIDFGSGPAGSPAHAFRGVWGMQVEIAVVNVGVPLINRQNTYSSNLFLVKISHPEGDTLKLEEKVCGIQLINFEDSDEPFIDLAWMLIPHRYLHSLPILEQWVEVPSAQRYDPFETTQSVEVRGSILDDPENDLLPNRQDFNADPQDPRFWDQDRDGHVAITTLMDGVLRGQIYNVQRWKASYHGSILDADHVRGLSSIENQQLIISASSSSLIYDTATEIHQDQDRTFHRLMRLSQDANCADLIREANRENSWLRHTNHMLDLPDP